ncbi:MAG: hypothetical protein NTV38_06535 [Chloroflexi bacterium]|nr:hypothetical protein [Chloroflexota bacterium]
MMEKKEWEYLMGFALPIPDIYTIIIVIPRKPEFDWRDYTCFWHELTKLSYPDSMCLISNI